MIIQLLTFAITFQRIWMESPEKKLKKGYSVDEVADMQEEDVEVIAALVKELE